MSRNHSNAKILSLLLLILIAGFAVRLYDLKDPPLDFHATRQLRSAIITRAFYYNSLPGADPTLAERAGLLAQLETYEPPIMEWLVSRMNLLIGEDVFWTGRIFSALFWALGGFVLFLTGRKIASAWGALISLLIYFFLPMSVIMSRSFQPDPWMCFWVILFLWAILRWTETQSWAQTLLCGLIGGIAVIVKLFAVFFVGMMFIGALAALWRKTKLNPLIAKAFVMGLILIAPSFIYFLLLNRTASAGFFSSWVVSLSGMIRNPEFYGRWAAMIKGITGLILPLFAVTGVLIMSPDYRAVLLGGWAGYFLYGLFVPYQMVTHEYYSLILIPLTALSCAPIFQLITERLKTGGKLVPYAAALIFLAAAFYGGYAALGTLRSSDYSLEPAGWRKAGEAIPEGTAFIALTGDYGMRLNYYGWQSPSRMWPDRNDAALSALQGKEAEDFPAFFNAQVSGMDYFLVTAESELEQQPLLREALSVCPVFDEGNGFKLYDLSAMAEKN